MMAFKEIVKLKNLWTRDEIISHNTRDLDRRLSPVASF